MRKLTKVCMGILTIISVSCSENEMEIIETRDINEFRRLDISDIKQLVHNEKDEEIRRLNDISYELCEEFKKYVASGTRIRKKINFEFNKSKNDAVVVTKIFDNSVINNNARTRSLLNRASQINIHNKTYQSELFLVNRASADFSKELIISPAFELEDTDDCEDCIAAYINNEVTGEWDLIMLSEDEALNTSNPVMVMSQNLAGADIVMPIYDGGGSSSGGGSTGSSSWDNKYRLKNFKMHDRYEGVGNSELGISYITYLYGYGTSAINRDQKVFKVDKDDIGKNLQVTGDLPTVMYRAEDYDNPDKGESFWFSAINFFERDWAHSKKTFSTVVHPDTGKTYSLSGNAKLSSDVYLYSGQQPVWLGNSIVSYGYKYLYSSPANGSYFKIVKQ
ncbi:hypothetical protein ABWH96_08995 [Marivirga tractuosa]|uniref:hypothetical protein n=1 Tax=Marivirga tractuosa TaxID=1006 RepID=UPI0035D0F640